jgi:hypothetical protein
MRALYLRISEVLAAAGVAPSLKADVDAAFADLAPEAMVAEGRHGRGPGRLRWSRRRRRMQPQRATEALTIAGAGSDGASHDGGAP